MKVAEKDQNEMVKVESMLETRKLLKTMRAKGFWACFTGTAYN